MMTSIIYIQPFKGKNLESSSEASNEQAIAPSLGGSADELRSQILGMLVNQT